MGRMAGDMEANAQSATAAAAMEAVSDDVLASMMREFEDMGKKEDFGQAVDGIMRQLLSKDIMYIPMRQICELVRTDQAGC